jgi:hypothetical protein
MADEVFDRVYSLTIGRNLPLLEKTIPQLLVQPQLGVPQLLADSSYSDFNTIPAGAITLTELRIVVDTSSTKEGSTNKQGATIEIYNLSRENQNFIQSDDVVLLNAGYRSVDGTDPPLIFSGQVGFVDTIRRGPDTITKLTCTAASVGRKNIRISKPASRGETNEDIVNYFADVAAANGIPTGFIFVPDIITYPSGLALAGSLFPVMEEFCKRFNLNCYITVGRLYIEPIAVTAPAVARVVVGELNIKDTIRPEDDSTGESSVDPAKKSGIVFNTFLNGDITPAKIVNVTFGLYRGEYLISSVDHKLDLEGKHWDTIVSCKRLH